jgi:hypothetical protein
VAEGTRLVVSWKRVPGASRYRVIVELADGRSVWSCRVATFRLRVRK